MNLETGLVAAPAGSLVLPDVGVGAATTLLYFAVSLSLQRLLLSARAARIQAGASPTATGLRWGSSARLGQSGTGR
jgi:hypothetical protein